jgi:hypothetical protein
MRLMLPVLDAIRRITARVTTLHRGLAAGFANTICPDVAPYGPGRVQQYISTGPLIWSGYSLRFGSKEVSAVPRAGGLLTGLW